MSVHTLDFSVEQARAMIRYEFEKNRMLQSLPVIDGLILRGTIDLIETVSLHKQNNHILAQVDKQDRELDLLHSQQSLRLAPANAPNLAEKSKHVSGFLFDFQSGFYCG